MNIETGIVTIDELEKALKSIHMMCIKWIPV